MLNISRPNLIRLLDKGGLPYHRTGNRRKIRFADVLAYRSRLHADRLMTLDQELGQGYACVHITL